MLWTTDNPFPFNITDKTNSKFNKSFYIIIRKTLLAQQYHLLLVLWLQFYGHLFVLYCFCFFYFICYFIDLLFLIFFVIRKHILVFRSYEWICITIYVVYIRDFYVHDNYSIPGPIVFFRSSGKPRMFYLTWSNANNCSCC